jgi:4-amino-4-deoxy-L-arabinose transferase-like glycosyltransferase
MLHHLNCRAGHYLLLLAVTVALYLPNLGAASLWDIDEGNNAEAAREMLESRNLIVPTFNGELRVDKPALLYWLQIAGYQTVGINEFGARLPSALAAMIAVLGSYELGRRLFGPASALLGGLILASTTAFTGAAHFANPDALLNACTVLALLAFWHGFARNQAVWLVPMSTCLGLGVLAKGPVGLVLPDAVVWLFLLWTGRLRFLFSRWTIVAAVAFILVMAPWYAWVGADTKGAFLKGFFLTHNIDRALNPMENHRGPFYYYAVALLLGFLPWSAFLAAATWDNVKALRHLPSGSARDSGFAGGPRSSVRFLSCWVAVYFLFFSLAATKLPNYILPLYAPLALLTGHFLERWRSGTALPPAWLTRVSLAGMALLGVLFTIAILMASGVLPAPRALGEPWPWLKWWIPVGAVPVVGAALAWHWLRRQQRGAVLVTLVATAVVFVGLLAAAGPAALEARKAPRPLARILQEAQQEPEIRVGCYEYFQPSLVFYCQRQVRRCGSRAEAVEFLRTPLPVYLFVPASVWERDLRAAVRGPYHLLARHHDLYRKCDVVLVTNQ